MTVPSTTAAGCESDAWTGNENNAQIRTMKTRVKKPMVVSTQVFIGSASISRHEYVRSRRLPSVHYGLSAEWTLIRYCEDCYAIYAIAQGAYASIKFRIMRMVASSPQLV